MRWTFPIALALIAPAAANASGLVGAMPMTADDAVAYNYWPPAGRPTTKELLARLDRLCASKRKADQRRCEESWRVINKAYAELQAKKAARGGE